MSNTESTNQVINFLVRIAEDPSYKIQYKEKQMQIMSGDFQKIQGAVGIVSVCYMLTHSDD